MYNRYIPQPDGSYRRSQFPDAPQNVPRPVPSREPPRQPAQPEYEPEHHEEPPCQKEQPCQTGQPCAHMRTPRPYRPSSPPPRQNNRQPEQKDFGIGSFLRQLLPKDFDAEDLLIVLLLLLMSGDSREDPNSALLTMALYLFM